MTREQIDEGFRDLVRRRLANGWYSFMWTDGRKWTFWPVGANTETFTRVEAIAYLQLEEDIAA